jgi:N-acetylmuramoyl-L-alanine amidase
MVTVRRHTGWALAVVVALLALGATPVVHAQTTGGDVLVFGDASDKGSLSGQSLQSPIQGIAGTPTGGGYWLVASDGGVFSFGDAAFHGSTGGIRLNPPVVGLASTPTGNGYWLVASDGGIFSYSDANFPGSTGGTPLNQPVVGMARTPTGSGYWLVASDGGIFNYGDAGFLGSTGSITLNAPVVGMASTPTGKGYWLVASDGGIFNYGDAGFFGSTGGTPLNSPIVGMAATPTGKGYWLVASDGGIFNYGDAGFFGSAGGQQLRQPVAGMAATPSGQGYRLAEGERGLAGKVIAIDPGHNGANGSHPDQINQLVDIVNGRKACDTTGTSTNDGYTESAYTLDVANRLASLLRSAGATVVMTRTDNSGVGPCINQRAAIGNQAHAAAAVSIHADGGPPGGRGFHVIEPAPVGPNDGIVDPSARLAVDLRDAFTQTGMPVSDYIGSNGLDRRSDLGGLNLSTVPKVFIETGNMRNATDAGLLKDSAFRQRAAASILSAMERFLA